MLKEPWHPGTLSKNAHLEWMPSDTKESFERMMQDPEHRRYFAEQGWDQPWAISYKLNSHGFRCAEFTNDPCVIALGCSYTFGIGLPVDKIWPSLVGMELGLSVANLAWGGSCSDACYRLLRYWIQALNTAAVMILTPPKERIELLLDRTGEIPGQPLAEVYLPQSLSEHFNPNDVYLNHWFMQIDNQLINREKNLLAMQALCDQNKVPFFEQNTETTMTRSREDIGYARDYLHGGPKIHKEIADIFIQQFRDSQSK